ncbi:MAG: hypothetical protein P0Y53_04350 [Candidatus Pseudobacter hemicellulosilyticus]|uniref:HEPN domain-containing protein n=1 Tax=Candidatus Pseudobacter hemicellulosilyticus TaxID=3121375 RepID=A0AAJ6BGI1_9BACT|nr:MAG: hypothetical protein P0Y53_04350 [Pseudobacter sp.]
MKTLTYLITHRMKDARVLADKRRFLAAVYIAGYAVELALKYRICLHLQFEYGFPETKAELVSELTNVNRSAEIRFSVTLPELKSHNFEGLSEISMVNIILENTVPKEWKLVNTWVPAIRYQKKRFTEKQAAIFLKAAERIIQLMQ